MNLAPHPEGGRDARDPETAPAIIIHSLAHAVAALSAAAEAGRAITLASPPDGGIYAGPGWFREVMQAAREAVPEASFTAILDCGDDAGAAMAAIRTGIEAVIFTGHADVAARLADIADHRGARLLTKRPELALDLGAKFFNGNDTSHQHCAEFLRSSATQQVRIDSGSV